MLLIDIMQFNKISFGPRFFLITLKWFLKRKNKIISTNLNLAVDFYSIDLLIHDFNQPLHHQIIQI